MIEKSQFFLKESNRFSIGTLVEHGMGIKRPLTPSEIKQRLTEQIPSAVKEEKLTLIL